MSKQQPKTGRMQQRKGYWVLYWWNRATKKMEYEYEHRQVWVHHFGPIPPGHSVHHLDGNPANNTIENLRCIPNGPHSSEHRLREWKTKRRPPPSWCVRCNRKIARSRKRRGLCHSCYQTAWQRAKRRGVSIEIAIASF